MNSIIAEIPVLNRVPSISSVTCKSNQLMGQNSDTTSELYCLECMITSDWHICIRNTPTYSTERHLYTVLSIVYPCNAPTYSTERHLYTVLTIVYPCKHNNLITFSRTPSMTQVQSLNLSPNSLCVLTNASLILSTKGRTAYPVHEAPVYTGLGEGLIYTALPLQVDRLFPTMKHRHL